MDHWKKALATLFIALAVLLGILQVIVIGAFIFMMGFTEGAGHDSFEIEDILVTMAFLSPVVLAGLLITQSTIWLGEAKIELRKLRSLFIGYFIVVYGWWWLSRVAWQMTHN